MQQLKVDEKFLKDSILTEGYINFDRSHAQKKPCPDYLLQYPKKNTRFEVTYEKCDKTATFQSLKKVR